MLICANSVDMFWAVLMGFKVCSVNRNVAHSETWPVIELCPRLRLFRDRQSTSTPAKTILARDHSPFNRNRNGTALGARSFIFFHLN